MPVMAIVTLGVPFVPLLRGDVLFTTGVDKESGNQDLPAETDAKSLCQHITADQDLPAVFEIPGQLVPA